MRRSILILFIVCSLASAADHVKEASAFAIRPYLMIRPDIKPEERDERENSELTLAWQYSSKMNSEDRKAPVTFYVGSEIITVPVSQNHGLSFVNVPRFSAGAEIVYLMPGLDQPRVIPNLKRSGEISFWLTSDFHFGDHSKKKLNDMVDLMVSHPADVLVGAGDFMGNNATPDSWPKLLNALEKVTATSIIAAVPGNRDYKHSLNGKVGWSQYMRNYFSSWFFVYDFGDVRMVMLNSNFSFHDQLREFEKNFLNDVLKLDPKPWTIVVSHNSPLNAEVLSGDFKKKVKPKPNAETLRREILPLFEGLRSNVVWLAGDIHLHQLLKNSCGLILTVGSLGGNSKGMRQFVTHPDALFTRAGSTVVRLVVSSSGIRGETFDEHSNPVHQFSFDRNLN
jgi:predicted phosphodiesterase